MIGLGLWPLLLPVAAFSGWAVGRTGSKESSQTASLSREYYVGLNYLLNEQPDKAVDVFIKLLEVDGDTVETHLALGSLFRRRGEFDRAIRVHQNLIARPQLSKEQRSEALLELGRDYMGAGVLDRAERIFREIVDIDSDLSQQSLQYLLEIYQQEKAWENAITVAQKLQSISGENMHNIIAHHYCEMAEQALKAGRWDNASDLLKRATLTDRKSVRASLLLADLDVHNGRYKEAIKSYRMVRNQDPDYLSEAILPMVTCYERLGKKSEFITFLQETLNEHPRISVVLALASSIHQEQGSEAAIDFVTAQLRANPSVRGLNQLIEWHLDSTEGKVKEKLQVLQDITHALMQSRPIYRCHHCGFSGRSLHWQCPGCKHWDTVKPIHGLEGD